MQGTAKAFLSAAVPMTISPSDVGTIIIIETPKIYNNIASAVFLFWDAWISLGQEVELVWWSPLSVVKVLYFVSRYYGLSIKIFEVLFYMNAIRTTPAICENWKLFETISGPILTIAVDSLLIIRAIAFFANTPSFRWFIIGIYIAQTIGGLWILGFATPRMDVVPNPFPRNLQLPGCLTTTVPKTLAIFWIPGAVFQTLLFTLVAIRFIKTNRGRAAHIRGGLRNNLIRDGTWAFAVIFAAFVWCSVAWDISAGQGDISLSWLYTALSFCGTRLVLNLRAVAANDLDNNTTRGPESLELTHRGIRFADMEDSIGVGWKGPVL